MFIVAIKTGEKVKRKIYETRELMAIFRSNLCIKLIEQQNYCTARGTDKRATRTTAATIIRENNIIKFMQWLLMSDKYLE